MSTRISRRNVLLGGLGSGVLGAKGSGAGADEVEIVVPSAAGPRVIFGAERLKKALLEKRFRVTFVESPSQNHRKKIFVGNQQGDPSAKPALARAGVSARQPRQDEGFVLASDESRGNMFVVGGRDSGVMYGCFELAEKIESAGGLPEKLKWVEEPRLRFRGTNLFWMKWGSQGYDWPLTGVNFPWFFDRNLMSRYLDLLAESRFNTIYFWSGHPFPYLLELPKYPEARMLSERELESNVEHFKWFTAEADRRGIWTVLHFYNIHVSPAFAESHKAESVRVTNPAATPLLSAYTRHCVGEFIRSYPSVGLLVCAGEALETKKEEWIRDVIVAGIKDSGKEPPLIVREWTIDRERFKEIVVPSYSNLYTMMKHNVEMVVSPVPDPRHTAWSKLTSHHLVNLHENADVKPLRWGSPPFIREMVQEWLKIGVAGAHIYPMVSWLWPESLDRVEPPLLTIDRDWIWLQAFGRYCWNPDREEQGEREYWTEQLRKRFGSQEVAEKLLVYYESTGPVMPGIQNLLSIHNMNAHPTLVGRDASVNSILNALRMNSLDVSLARPLDRSTVRAYARRFGGNEQELLKNPPMSVREYVECMAEASGAFEDESRITPRKLFEILQSLASEGTAAANSAASSAARGADEVRRFASDAEILSAAVEFYTEKTGAAISKGLYDRQGQVEDLERMLDHLEKSVESYRRLCEKASKAYRGPSDLAGVLGWEDMSPAFQDELRFYREQKTLSEKGAEILCLGVNGPFEDYSNAFHWSVADEARKRSAGLSTYLITSSMIQKARLIVVYNLSDRFVRAKADAILAWVNRGGRLLVWDESARLQADGGLLEGLEVNGPSEERVSAIGGPTESLRIQFADLESPLIGSLRNARVEKTGQSLLPNSIKSFSRDWKVLAYTVVFNKDYEFLPPPHLVGPIWVKRNDSQFCPLILERAIGTGRVAIMQIGRWQREFAPHQQFCATLAADIFVWAGWQSVNRS